MDNVNILARSLSRCKAIVNQATLFAYPDSLYRGAVLLGSVPKWEILEICRLAVHQVTSFHY